MIPKFPYSNQIASRLSPSGKRSHPVCISLWQEARSSWKSYKGQVFAARLIISDVIADFPSQEATHLASIGEKLRNEKVWVERSQTHQQAQEIFVIKQSEKIWKMKRKHTGKKTCRGFTVLSTVNCKVQSSERWLESIALGVNKSLARVQKCYVHGQRVQKMIVERRLNQLPESFFHNPMHVQRLFHLPGISLQPPICLSMF